MQRNKRLRGEDQPPIKVAVHWSIDMAHDLLEIVKPKEKVSPGFAKPAWKPPPVGWVKCNTDGAYRPDAGHGASGVILRDSTGLLLGGRSRWYPHALDALMMEALACRDGMLLAKEWQ